LLGSRVGGVLILDDDARLVFRHEGRIETRKERGSNRRL